MARRLQPDAVAPHLIEDWAESQQQVMQAWWNGLSDSSKRSPWSDFYQGYLKASDQAVKAALENQAKWVHQCLQAFAPDSGPSSTALKKWRDDMDKVVDEWIQAELQCWEACVANVSKQNGGASSAKALQSCWQAYAHTAQAMLTMPSLLMSAMVKQSTEDTSTEASASNK